ncbi:galactose-specific lectin nattectin-like [Myxocyprinus asiaticus]|uniref:galactose-specific lectin nattectin-like n=1 Tax=Myxocyprinus asiaticus TaxID=70543 RepID=UPI0022222C4B|nr:galactose-specific lectin nattectin-like [Myxocyprinus asiaticus]
MSKALSMLCFIVLLTIEFSQQGTIACSFGWNEFDGRCFKYVATAMTWADAEAHCVSAGANLVSIHDERQYTFIKELIRTYDIAQKDTWIGLSDQYKEGTWFWTDGSRVSYTMWATGQPDHTNWVGRGREHCVGTYYRNNALWNDFLCSHYHPFICVMRDCK